MSSTAHTDVFADGDEFAAAFESRAARFELYDGVRFLLSIDDEESISEPQVIKEHLQLDMREFHQPAAAKSLHAHRLERCMYVAHNVRVCGDVSLWPMSTRESLGAQMISLLSIFICLHALRLTPLAAVAAQCHQPVTYRKYSIIGTTRIEMLNIF